MNAYLDLKIVYTIINILGHNLKYSLSNSY